MEEFDEENLRRVFGKLRNAESAARGAEWSELESKLPRVANHRRWMTASVWLLVIGFVAVNGLVWLRNDDQQTLPGTPITSPAKNNEEPRQVVAEGQSTKKRFSPDPLNKSTTSGTMLVSTVAPIADQSVVAPDIKRDLRVEGDVLVPASEELRSRTTEEEDTTAAVLPPLEERKDRFLRFQLSAGYLFGVVMPYPNDRLLISSYQTKPGAAAKVLIDYPLVSTRHVAIRGAAFYHLVHKPFQFDVLEYGLEKISSYPVRKTATQHHLGLGLAMVPARGRWEVQTGFSSLLGNRESELLSSRWLHVSVSRSILPTGKKIEILGSVDVLVPLGDQSNYFRYVPIQFSLGLRRQR